MTRWLAMFAAVLTLVVAADAGAQTAQNSQKAQKTAAYQIVPLVIYLAKGRANTCGDGCSEWIAIEGGVDPDAAGRVQAFLKRHAGRKLPVYFHSLSGHGGVSRAIGRQFRQHTIVAGIGTTVPRACLSAGDTSAACRAAKRSAQPVEAELLPDALCPSGCVEALLGGRVRHVPPAARLAISSVRFAAMSKKSDGSFQEMPGKKGASFHNPKVAEYNAELRRYIADMGFGTALYDAITSQPSDRPYVLSRDEIARFGIDPREFVETPWFLSQFASHIGKSIVEARGPERNEYRVSAVHLRCSSALNAAIQYHRALASDEVGRPSTVRLSIGKYEALFYLDGKGTRQDSLDTGSLFSSASGTVPFEELEAAAVQGTMTATVSDPRAEAGSSRVVALSTEGLGESIKILRSKCAPSAQHAPWPDAAGAPVMPAQPGSQPFPASPYGARPVPELGLGVGR